MPFFMGRRSLTTLWLLAFWSWFFIFPSAFARQNPDPESAVVATFPLKWDPDSFRVYDLPAVVSPTAILKIGTDWFLGTDFEDPWPGVQRLTLTDTPALQSRVVKFLPQQAVTSLVHGPEGQLMVLSSRRFSNNIEDWNAQILSLELDQFQQTDTVHLDIPNLCFNQLRACGFSGMAALDNTHWLGLKQADPSSLYLLQPGAREWTAKALGPIGFNRKFVRADEMKLKQGFLVFLIKDHWKLAVIDTRSSFSESHFFELTTVFDFKHLFNRFYVARTNLQYEGLAEGFEIDETGSLYILLNNRGFAFRDMGLGKPNGHPKLVVFSPVN